MKLLYGKLSRVDRTEVKKGLLYPSAHHPAPHSGNGFIEGGKQSVLF